MFFIHKKARRASRPYEGPSCTKAGVTPGKSYATEAEAKRDAEKLSKVDPVGFKVSPLDGAFH